MTVPHNSEPDQSMLWISRRSILAGMTPFIIASMLVGWVVLKKQPELAGSIANGVLPRIAWPFNDYHASQIVGTGRNPAEGELYRACIAVFGLIWQVWIAIVLFTTALSANKKPNPAKTIGSYVLIAVIAVLISYIPLSAHGGYRTPSYNADIGQLISHAGMFMMLFYGAAAVVADGIGLWLLTRARHSN